MAAHWEHFSHGADIGVRGRGDSLAEALVGAALALTGVVTDPSSVRPLQPVAIRCQAPGPDILLVDWLNALIYEMATRSMLFSRFELHCDEQRLDAVAWGEHVEVARHQPVIEVKGATLTQLEVRQEPPGTWLAQCVVDV